MVGRSIGHAVTCTGAGRAPSGSGVAHERLGLRLDPAESGTGARGLRRGELRDAGPREVVEGVLANHDRLFPETRLRLDRIRAELPHAPQRDGGYAEQGEQGDAEERLRDVHADGAGAWHTRPSHI